MIFLDWPGAPVGKGDLLMHFDGDFLDYSPKNRTITDMGAGASRSSAHPAWGSEGFVGNGIGWLETVDDGAFDIGARKFQAEFQLYIDSAAVLNTDNILIGKWGLVDGSWFINIFGPTERLNLGRRSSGNYFFNSLSAVLPRDTLMHVAVWRSIVSGDVYCAIDGFVDTIVSSATTFDSTTNDLAIGAVCGGGAKLPAGVYFDELRYLVDDDVELGTTDFPPPTGPYT